nr:GNAT family N-acetyltransferase [Acutalibacter sp. M00118]
MLVEIANHPAFAAWAQGKIVGLAAYTVAAGVCEIVALHRDAPGQGIGRALVEQVKAAAKGQGCRTLIAVAANDDLDAIGSYQQQGFDMARLYRGSLLYARQAKPQLPEIGRHGIPLRHEIEFEMFLD